ncbi:MAG: peptidase M22 [Clostridia bacterium]|nr:peptidase M22 [Clostridia bacterium]
MKKNVVMGIDTSNYTTSVALMYSDGELIANLKRPLPVKQGEHGLRQSDAVFAHVKNLPDIMQEARSYISGNLPVAVGVSTRPRNVESSYMPCFLSGVAAAESVAASLAVPLYRFSHQCGHIMAAIYSSKAFHLLDKSFAAFHVSGGTTEMLKVEFSGTEFSAELVGETADLNAGQVIDRVGTYLGLPFPSGKYLEELAKMNTKKIPAKKPKLSDMKINLSGLENMAVKLYGETSDKSLTAAFVLAYIEKGISSLAQAYLERFGNTEFLFAGGVMSNSIIREKLKTKFNAYFAEPHFSADNAVGIAELARRSFNRE